MSHSNIPESAWADYDRYVDPAGPLPGVSGGGGRDEEDDELTRYYGNRFIHISPMDPVVPEDDAYTLASARARERLEHYGRLTVYGTRKDSFFPEWAEAALDGAAVAMVEGWKGLGAS